MRVGLIIPPSPFLLDERVFPSLGVLRVAAVLKAAGLPVSVLDLSGVTDPEGATAAWAESVQPTHVGLTATTPQYPAAVKLAAVLRRHDPGVPIILGGPHVTLTWAGTKRTGANSRAGVAMRAAQGTFDVCVAGDGERAMFEALGRTGTGHLLDADRPGSPWWLTAADLDALPWPARDAIDLASYHYRMPGAPAGTIATSVIAQLGCPFGCTFCGGRASPSFRRVRRRANAVVLAEVRHLFEAYGVTGFMFQDDELNVNPDLVGFLRGLAALQSTLGVRFACRGFLKGHLLTDGQAAALASAGFREVLVGFESADDQVLRAIQKCATRADNSRALAIARRHGLRVKALMSLGHAGESPESIEATRRWLLAEAPDDFDVTVITPYPGTAYFDQAIQTGPTTWTYTCPKTGGRLHAEPVDFTTAAAYYKGVPGEYVSHVWTDRLSRADLVAARDALETEVRGALGLPWPAANPAARDYEHSMGAR